MGKMFIKFETKNGKKAEIVKQKSHLLVSIQQSYGGFALHLFVNLCLYLCLANKPLGLPGRRVAVAVPSGLALKISPR